MSKLTQQQLVEAIEPLVDRSSVADVLLALARVLNEKAEHLRVNWQDESAAKRYDLAAKRLDEFSQSPRIVAVSEY